MNLISIYILLFSRFVAGIIESNEQLTDSSSSISNFDIDKIQSQARYDHRLLSKEIKNHNINMKNKLTKFKTENQQEEYGASCFIINREYYHGQQIKRKNNCEVCLCLDGEIFCWWKKCIFRKKKKLFKNIWNSNKKLPKTIKKYLNKTEINLELKPKIEIDNSLKNKTIDMEGKSTTILPMITETGTVTATTLNNNEAKCIVMGVSYNIGDILPQDTGNCLQCECTENLDKRENPRITCTPHNCPPLILPDLLDETEF